MKWLAQGYVTPAFQAPSPRIAGMISAVGTNSLGQHWLQAVCRHVPHCLSILTMLTIFYSSIHSTTHVWILLNEISHTWDFGSLWALLEIWQWFKESPAKPDCRKQPWILIVHQENMCTLIISAHVCTHRYTDIQPTIKITKWILVPGSIQWTLNLRARNHCYKSKMLPERC